MALLSNRAYPSGAIIHKLIEKGYPEDESAEAAGWLSELGYLDDGAYIASVIRSHKAKGYGPRRTLLYLQSQGISREAAEEALENSCGGEDAYENIAAAIDAFLHKRASASPDYAEKQKLAAALSRRGFDYSDINAGLERLED